MAQITPALSLERRPRLCKASIESALVDRRVLEA